MILAQSFILCSWHKNIKLRKYFFTILKSLYFCILTLSPISLLAQNAKTNHISNKESEIIAPIESHSSEDHLLTVFGYKILITNKTKINDFNKSSISENELKTGQWIKIKGYRRSDGTLIAASILKVEKRPLYISINDEGDTKIITNKRTQRLYRNPLELFLEDESKGVSFSFHPAKNLLFGGKFEYKTKLELDRDLDKLKKKDKKYYAGILWLDLLWKYGESSFLLIEPSTQYSATKYELSNADKVSESKLSRAYTYISLSEHFALNLGRQDYTDERQWLYDEILDAGRIFAYLGPVQLDLSISKGRDLYDQQNSTQGINNTVFDARYYTSPKHFISLWYIAREDQTDRNFSPTLYGITTVAKPKKRLQYWLVVAKATGKAGSEDIDGVGLDVGFAYIFNSKQRPHILLGLAAGTGRTDKTSQAGAFRQTGLEDNSDKFGGLIRFHYYGEVMRPELSNKYITTMGLGERLNKNFSIDMVFHTYAQVVASTDLGDTRIKATPTGLEPDLGSEMDIIAGYRNLNARAEFVFGRFEPGVAFTKQYPSFLVKLKYEYKF